MVGFTSSGFTASGFTTAPVVGPGAQSTLSFTVNQATDTTQTISQLDSTKTISHGDSTKSIKRQGV